MKPMNHGIILWGNTLVLVGTTALKHISISSAPCMWPPTTLPGEESRFTKVVSVSFTYINMTQCHVQVTIHFHMYSHLFNLISRTNLGVGMLTYLQAPFTPLWRLHCHRVGSSHATVAILWSLPDISKFSNNLQNSFCLRMTFYDPNYCLVLLKANLSAVLVYFLSHKLL